MTVPPSFSGLHFKLQTPSSSPGAPLQPSRLLRLLLLPANHHRDLARFDFYDAKNGGLPLAGDVENHAKVSGCNGRKAAEAGTATPSSASLSASRLDATLSQESRNRGWTG